MNFFTRGEPKTLSEELQPVLAALADDLEGGDFASAHRWYLQAVEEARLIHGQERRYVQGRQRVAARMMKR